MDLRIAPPRTELLDRVGHRFPRDCGRDHRSGFKARVGTIEDDGFHWQP